MDLTAGEARTRFSGARVAHLATSDADGVPHLVPICFALGVNGAAATRGAHDVLYTAIDGKPKKTPALRRLANIRANDRVSVLVDFYAEDWSKLWWVRLDGRARILDADPGAADADLTSADERHFDTEAELATALLTARYPQYLRAPFSGPVIAVDVERWTGWTASHLLPMSAGQSHAVQRVERVQQAEPEKGHEPEAKPEPDAKAKRAKKPPRGRKAEPGPAQPEESQAEKKEATGVRLARAVTTRTAKDPAAPGSAPPTA